MGEWSKLTETMRLSKMFRYSSFNNEVVIFLLEKNKIDKLLEQSSEEEKDIIRNTIRSFTESTIKSLESERRDCLNQIEKLNKKLILIEELRKKSGDILSLTHLSIQ